MRGVASAAGVGGTGSGEGSGSWGGHGGYVHGSMCRRLVWVKGSVDEKTVPKDVVPVWRAARRKEGKDRH